jgi:hypothetical protein
MAYARITEVEAELNKLPAKAALSKWVVLCDVRMGVQMYHGRV